MFYHQIPSKRRKVFDTKILFKEQYNTTFSLLVKKRSCLESQISNIYSGAAYRPTIQQNVSPKPHRWKCPMRYSHRTDSSKAAQKMLEGSSLCQKLSMVCLDVTFSRLFPPTLKTVNFPLLFLENWVLKDLKGTYPCSLKDVVFLLRGDCLGQWFQGRRGEGRGKEKVLRVPPPSSLRASDCGCL